MFSITILLTKFDSKLLFTDTDSLNYEIKLEYVYEEFFKHKHLFDLSNYPKGSKFFYRTSVLGKTNDEFVGLKSKIYSMKNIDGKKSNTATAVNIVTEYNEFKDTLFS